MIWLKEKKKKMNLYKRGVGKDDCHLCPSGAPSPHGLSGGEDTSLYVYCFAATLSTALQRGIFHLNMCLREGLCHSTLTVSICL